MEQTTQRTAGAGISRRDVIKRGAVIGGTLMWAAPTIQTVGMRAAFGDDTTSTGSPRTGQDISYLAVVIQCPANVYWKFKVEDGGVGTCGEIEFGGNVPCCPDPPNWDIATGGFPPGMDANDIDCSDDTCWNITIPDGCALVGVAMGGGGEGSEECSPPDVGFCETSYTLKAGNTYQFCSPPE